MERFIHDKEHDEHYVPEQLQCEECSNEAVRDGMCKDHKELKLSRARQIMIEINKQGGVPLARLQNKCAWEHCSQLKVILEWGDPRRWK